VTTLLAIACFACVLLPGFAQDSGNFYQPLTLAPNDSSSTEGGATNSIHKSKGAIDVNDPRVMAAISEAMDSPLSELIIGWNQFDAIQVHFPSTSLYDERDDWGYRYQYPDDTPGSRWDFRIYLMPVVPAPWGKLAKGLRALE
jgi:hypothetical protein